MHKLTGWCLQAKQNQGNVMTFPDKITSFKAFIELMLSAYYE